MVTMLSGKATKPKTLKTKDGRTYTAPLAIKDGRVGPVFTDSPERQNADRSKITQRKGICKCPLCADGQIFRGKDWYICSNRGNGCKFIVGMAICSAPITENDVKDLVAGKVVGPKKFTWKSGKQGEAKLKSSVVEEGNEKDFKTEFVFS